MLEWFDPGGLERRSLTPSTRMRRRVNRTSVPALRKDGCFWEGHTYDHVVDPHATEGPAVVAEVVLDGRVGHLEERKSGERERGQLLFHTTFPDFSTY